MGGGAWPSSSPDLVVNTGDNLAHPRAVPATLAALGPLLDLPGLFVFGSNDYFGPTFKNPARYLWKSTKRHHGVPLPWRDLRAALLERGWLDATHARDTLTAGGLTIAAAGVDDPHIRLDRYDRIAGRPPGSPDLRLGLTHSPEPRVLDGSPPTATTSCSRATPTAASSGCPATARSSPTAASTVPAPAAPPGGARTCGCTSPPVWARPRPRRSASPARPRPAC